MYNFLPLSSIRSETEESGGTVNAGLFPALFSQPPRVNKKFVDYVALTSKTGERRENISGCEYQRL
ncbi:MAG: hypothetical protein C4532_19450 [Candidatus Abyssobacteria bacterium SURF_17]|uniref:Uncharacterized protein n=1 Tax=Candidatus Abyssobacteria bacterium SURF_17 TaxID=2093361 RepID=A0A419ENP4_9BACT|nr:MAG: hypothetical protein C4532_19450 [Candidatus Abyssubacteria bacterium SURF_17]